MWDLSMITNAGAELISNWPAGEICEICSAAGGAGTALSSELAAMTALTDQRQTASIVSMETHENSVTVKIQFGPAESAYTMTQIGFFARMRDEDPILLAVFQDDGGISVPAAASGFEFLYSFYGELIIDNTSSMAVSIDWAATVSASTLAEKMETKQDKITATGLLVRNEDGDIVSASPETDYVQPSYLHKVAHTGSYNDLESLPKIPDKTSDLTNDSEFIDKKGLSSHNTNENTHENLWIPGCYYGTSSTGASVNNKVVMVPKFALKTGCRIVVQFSVNNTVTAPSLNVGDTGAKAVVSMGKDYFDVSESWKAGDYVLFQYNGTSWILLFNFRREYLTSDNKAVANGLATLDGTGKVPAEQLPSMNYIPLNQKGAANGVATLAQDGKVPAEQLRGGFVISKSAPSDKTMLWIDERGVMRYYDAESKSWNTVVPTWG